MKTLLTKQTQSVVLTGEMPAKEVAVAIGKPYPTLMRELNPYDEGAKLGAETLLAIMKTTGDTRVLHYMARELGCVVVADSMAARKAPARNVELAWA